MSQTKARKMIKKIASPGAAPHIRIHERIHIFIVDDDHEARANIASPLVNSGFTVHFVVRAAECLKRLSDEACDLIIAEARMLDMDGLTFLKRVKSAAPWLPVVLISCIPDVPAVVTAIKLGAEDFLQKPPDPEALLQMVERILGQGDLANSSVGQILSKAEKKVLSLILSGGGNKEIAFRLQRSLRTVERHRSSIMYKLGVDNVVDLVKKTAFTSLEGVQHRAQSVRATQMG